MPPAGVARAREVLNLMKSGALDGLSIGFQTVRSKTDGFGKVIYPEDEADNAVIGALHALSEARGEAIEAIIEELADYHGVSRQMLIARNHHGGTICA